MNEEDYWAGFINATACFTFLIFNNSIYPHFSITLSGNNLEILFRLKKFLGFGNICLTSNGAGIYYTDKLDNALRIIKMVEGKLIGSKSEDLSQWRKGCYYLLKHRELFRRGKNKLNNEVREFILSLRPNRLGKKMKNNERLIEDFKYFTKTICVPYSLK